MNQPYTAWEVMLYAFLDSFPYMMLGVFAFRSHRRFGARLTAGLLALVEAAFVALLTFSLMTRSISMTIVDIVFGLNPNHAPRRSATSLSSHRSTTQTPASGVKANNGQKVVIK